MHLPVFKNELQHLVNEGVLRRAGATHWAAGTFIIPKADQTVRWISDFRKLNEWIDVEEYPLPKIHKVVQDQKPFKYITLLDVAMQYYTFRLDEESQELCTIITPFGKYHYTVLPMGISQSPSWSQATMEEILGDFIINEGVVVYIDDIKITSDTWEEHLDLIDRVLKRLQDNGFTVKPQKCQWARDQALFLGFLFTQTGPKPWPKKIEAILKLAPPTNRTEVRAFCGAITFYRDMFPKRAHILAPITRLQSKDVPFEWTQECQEAFDTIKAVISQEIQFLYPDPNKPFEIYTDASNKQLGSIIKQEDKAVAFYTRKLSPTQANYSTIEKELLSIVETFKEFRSFLQGARITVYTDHANLIHAVENTNARILRWRLILEDFAPTFKHIQGSSNIEADGLSRAPLLEGQKSFESFIFFPPNVPNSVPYPMDFELLAQEQTQDQWLTDQRNRFPDKYQAQIMPIANGEQQLVCYRATPADTWRIYVPQQLVPQVTAWYHFTQGHCGADRLYKSITKHFYIPNFKPYTVTFVQECSSCQKNKLQGPGRGELPPKNITALPWDEVAVDLIGPWSFTLQGRHFTFQALTCVDPFTTLSEVIRIDNKTSEHVAMKFDMEWLSRYPRPLKCIHDQGTEFTGAPFQLLLQAYGIKDTPTTVKNPQANAVNERLHQTLENILRTFLNSPMVYYTHPDQVIEHCFASARYALRTAFNRALEASPGSIVFNRDMVLPIPYLADLHALQTQRQLKVDRRLLQENRKRYYHDYQVGDQVLIRNQDTKRKLNPEAIGPYTITEVHTNGTVVIQRSPHVFERINIRRLKPYNAQQD